MDSKSTFVGKDQKVYILRTYLTNEEYDFIQQLNYYNFKYMQDSKYRENPELLVQDHPEIPLETKKVYDKILKTLIISPTENVEIGKLEASLTQAMYVYISNLNAAMEEEIGVYLKQNQMVLPEPKSQKKT
jgi:hypothetical protein